MQAPWENLSMDLGRQDEYGAAWDGGWQEAAPKRKKKEYAEITPELADHILGTDHHHDDGSLSDSMGSGSSFVDSVTGQRVHRRTAKIKGTQCCDYIALALDFSAAAIPIMSVMVSKPQTPGANNIAVFAAVTCVLSGMLACCLDCSIAQTRCIPIGVFIRLIPTGLAVWLWFKGLNPPPLHPRPTHAALVSYDHDLNGLRMSLLGCAAVEIVALLLECCCRRRGEAACCSAKQDGVNLHPSACC